MDLKVSILLFVCLGLVTWAESAAAAGRQTRSRYYSSGCSVAGSTGCLGSTGYSSGYSSGSSYSSQSSYSSSSSSAAQQQQAGQLQIGQQLLDNEYDELTEAELIDTDDNSGLSRTVVTDETNADGSRRTRWRTIPGKGYQAAWSSSTQWSSQAHSTGADAAQTQLPDQSEIESLLQGLPEGVNITKQGSLRPGHTYFIQRRVYNWTSGARPVPCTTRACTVQQAGASQKASASRNVQYIQQALRNKGATVCGTATAATNCIVTSTTSERGESEELVEQAATTTEIRPVPTQRPIQRPIYVEKGPPPTRLPPLYVQQQTVRQKGVTSCGSGSSSCIITSSITSDRTESAELIEQQQRETIETRPAPVRPIHVEKGPPPTRLPPVYVQRQTSRNKAATACGTTTNCIITSSVTSERGESEELVEHQQATTETRPLPQRPIYVEKGPSPTRPPYQEIRPPPATKAAPVYNYHQQQSLHQEQQQRQTYQQQLSRPVSHIPATRATYTDYNSAEVQCINGIVRGKLITTARGREVYAFLGIPFARPPVGNLRFRKPEPLDVWDQPIDATRKPPACYQVNASSFPDNPGESQWNAGSISEDCLYLNIWIPATTFRAREQRLSDVLFWIYGGGFFSGSSSLDIYDGAILASENDIVVVSTQYRVGPLGFIFLDDAEAPGNVGLLDQVAALRWVNSNIRYFGGNPDSLTLIGESCGAVSVNLHLISPASRGLFTRGVLMSGVANAPYATVSPSEAQRYALDLARHVGCDSNADKREIINCLRQTDAGVLTAAQFQFFSSILKFPFVATIDREFLPTCPTRLMESNNNRADVIVGSVKDEGSFFLIYQYLRLLGDQRSPQVSHEQFINMVSETHRAITSHSQAEAISTYYTNWKNPEDSRINVQRLVDSVSDGFFTCHHRQFADQWSEKGNAVYQYYFTQRTSTNPWPEWAGVLHGDEIEYVFGVPLREPERFTEEEQQLSVHMMRLITDFAKTGLPSRNWQRYTERRPTFVELNAGRITDETSTELGPRANECAFWSKILPSVSISPGCQGDEESQGLLERYLSNACPNYAANGKLVLGGTKSKCSASRRYGLSC